jgi:hypothetical protein
VLKGLKLELSLAVVDRGSNKGGYGGSGGGSDEFGENPRGFPPHAIYTFASAGPDAIVLSTGPRPVYYSRVVTTKFQYFVSRPIKGGPNTEERLAYLDAMVRRQYRFFLNAQTSVSVEWRNERTFRARVAEERNKIAGTYERMLDLLLRGDYLTEAEARALPMDLNVEIIDHRTDRSRPLPDVTSISR